MPPTEIPALNGALGGKALGWEGGQICSKACNHLICVRWSSHKTSSALQQWGREEQGALLRTCPPHPQPPTEPQQGAFH